MKAHLVTLVVLDNQDYDAEVIVSELETQKHLSSNVLIAKTIDIPDWNDDHFLNHFHSKNEIVKFFDEDPKTKITYYKA